MREIKFRGWIKDKKVLQNVFIVEWAGTQVSSGFIKHINVDNNRYYSKDYTGGEENYILMQYTGLKDVNDKEIYEGDIVKYSLKGLYQVKWQEETTGFYPFVDDNRCDYCHGKGVDNSSVEVVGNIYENPELLERSK